jgi:hypothetical protein
MLARPRTPVRAVWQAVERRLPILIPLPSGEGWTQAGSRRSHRAEAVTFTCAYWSSSCVLTIDVCTLFVIGIGSAPTMHWLFLARITTSSNTIQKTQLEPWHERLHPDHGIHRWHQKGGSPGNNALSGAPPKLRPARRTVSRALSLYLRQLNPYFASYPCPSWTGMLIEII